MYFFTSSGWVCTASPNEQKMMPFSANSFLNVVTTDTESNTASTAMPGASGAAPAGSSIPSSALRSFNGIPSFSYVASSSGSTSSSDFSFGLGAEKYEDDW